MLGIPADSKTTARISEYLRLFDRTPPGAHEHPHILPAWQNEEPAMPVPVAPRVIQLGKSLYLSVWHVSCYNLNYIVPVLCSR